MVAKRDASCPLCGAKMSAAELLDACTELVDAHLGVLAARCPHCQGYLEVQPTSGRVDVGYLTGAGRDAHFAIAISLPFDALDVQRCESPPYLRLATAERAWDFRL